MAPNPSDLFATIYTSNTGERVISYKNPNNTFMRRYFGPVTLEKLCIKLIDPFGNLLNLHGHNWSFTLAVEQLYQY